MSEEENLTTSDCFDEIYSRVAHTIVGGPFNRVLCD